MNSKESFLNISETCKLKIDRTTGKAYVTFQVLNECWTDITWSLRTYDGDVFAPGHGLTFTDSMMDEAEDGLRLIFSTDDLLLEITLDFSPPRRWLPAAIRSAQFERSTIDIRADQYFSTAGWRAAGFGGLAGIHRFGNE